MDAAVRLIRILINIFLGICMLAWSGLSVAATAETPRERPDTTGPVITDTAIPQALGTATLLVPTFLSMGNSNFNSNWHRVGAGGDFQSLSAQLELYSGPLPRTEIYLIIPYLHNWASNVDKLGPNGNRSANFGGLGTCSLTGKYLLFDEQSRFPAVSGIVTVAFPTAHHLHLNPGNLGTDQLGLGAYSVTTGFNFFKYTSPVLLYANLWYTMYSAGTVAGRRNYYPDQITLNLALEWPFIKGRWVLLWELVSYGDAGRLIGHQANQPSQALISSLLGVEFLGGKNWAVVPGVYLDLLGKNTNCDIAPNLSLFYYF
jgi:hypothetical protein